MIGPMLDDLRTGVPVPEIALRFHRTLADIALEIAKRSAIPRVVLSGGCFQNKLLSELIISGLHERGINAYWHQRIPPNDGGISAGQVFAARVISKAH
jgi:hydrogenase maturation protein HypF